MAEEAQILEPGRAPRKRKLGKNKGRKKSSKKSKVMQTLQGQKKLKTDKKLKKLFRKRAREYNSEDDDDDDVSATAMMGTRSLSCITNKNEDQGVESNQHSEDEEGGKKVWTSDVCNINNSVSEDEGEEDGGIQPGIAKFVGGCRAFGMAFRNIIKKSFSDDTLGPVLSAHKKLIVDKLAEEESEHKIKGEAKKEKQMLAEKGHVKPATYLGSHEMFLISVATKGVVKLFNAVNKAQTAQKGLDPSRSKDAKEIRKRTKAAFFSELGKPSFPATGTSAKSHPRTGKELEGEEPAWAPLQDNYMLTSSRLKDWDKMPDKNVSDDIGKMSEDSCSDVD